jgi:uncharacterized protein DUF4340
MSNRQLTILGIAAGGMLVWAILQAHWASVPSATSSSPVYLLQGLSLERITQMVIGTDLQRDTDRKPARDLGSLFESDPNMITLVRSGRGYVISEKDEYFAEPEAIRQYLHACQSIQVKEKITSEKQNHRKLGVAPDDPDFSGTMVRFYQPTQEKDALKLVSGLVVSDYQEERKGNYVRRVDKNDVYLTTEKVILVEQEYDREEGGINLNTKVGGFLDKKLFDADRERTEKDNVDKVVVIWKEGNTQKGYILEQGDPNFLLTELLPGQKQKQHKNTKKNDCERVFEALKEVEYSDVHNEAVLTGKLKTINKDLAFDTMYQSILKDGTVYKLDIAKVEDTYFVKCSLENMPVLTKIPQKVSESETKEQHQDRVDQIMNHAKRFESKHEGWVYELKGWNAGYLSKKQEDLLEEKKKEEETKEETKTDPVTKEEAGKTETPAIGPQLPAPSVESKTKPAAPADPNQ